jgi:hypothetical protein
MMASAAALLAFYAIARARCAQIQEIALEECARKRAA